MFGISNLSIVPCRKEPSDKSEMVTQLLFGETFEILETLGSWCKIKIAHDSYECWIDKKQFLLITHRTFDTLHSTDHFCTNELIQIITNNTTSQLFPIVLGSTLPAFDAGDCVVEKDSYSYDGSFVNCGIPSTKNQFIETLFRKFQSLPTGLVKNYSLAS